MSRTFNTPVDVWLDMELPKLWDWIMIADKMLEEARAKTDVQQIGPGL
jgi:hypothetical protein